MSSEQTEKATPKKRQKATDQGDRLVSRELLSSSALVAGIVVLGFVGRSWTSVWRQGYHGCLELALPASTVLGDPSATSAALRLIVLRVTLPMVGVGIAACAAAILLGAVQGGGQLKFAAISPKWTRLSPVANAQHLFSQQSLVRLLKSSLPVAAIGLLAYKKLALLSALPVLSLVRLPATFQAVYELLLGSAVVMLGWSSIDFASTWWAREKRLRMSKQDVKDESKESEGSPQIKRRIRSIQRQMRGRKLRADVSKATVIITNPTHYAVALSFDFETMDPPRLLAKGRDLIAAEIREQARWAGIPIIENPPLARSLYKMVEPGQGIPFELYAAVAGILAYLYRSEVEQKLRQNQGSVSSPGGAGVSTGLATVVPSRASGAAQDAATSSLQGSAHDPATGAPVHAAAGLKGERSVDPARRSAAVAGASGVPHDRTQAEVVARAAPGHRPNLSHQTRPGLPSGSVSRVRSPDRSRSLEPTPKPSQGLSSGSSSGFPGGRSNQDVAKRWIAPAALASRAPRLLDPS